MQKFKFQLPTAEDDLWEQVVVALLCQRDVSEPQARDHLRLLEQLSFHKQFCHRTLTESFVLNTATWVAEELKLEGPGDKARKWSEDLEAWELLVLQGSGSETLYEFPIPGLDEYFAARHLAARWADGDPGYRKSLPSSKTTRVDKKVNCPNPHCRAPLRSFADLLRRPEYEEPLLLMAGLVKDVKREKLFLNNVFAQGRDWLFRVNFTPQFLCRCRHVHSSVVYVIWALLVSLLTHKVTGGKVDIRTRVVLCHTGLQAIGRTRISGNGELIIDYFGKALADPSAIALDSDWINKTFAWRTQGLTNQQLRKLAAYVLAFIGGPAIQPLVRALKKSKKGVRQAAANALALIEHE